MGPRALGRDLVIRAAEAAAPADGKGVPSIGTDGLPAGYRELGHGGIDAALPASLPMTEFRSALVLACSGPATEADPWRLKIVQRPGKEAAVDRLRPSYPESEDVTVRGRHGVLGTGADGTTALQWLDETGQLMTVQSTGLSRDDVMRFAGGLRVAHPPRSSPWSPARRDA